MRETKHLYELQRVNGMWSFLPVDILEELFDVTTPDSVGRVFLGVETGKIYDSLQIWKQVHAEQPFPG